MFEDPTRHDQPRARRYPQALHCGFHAYPQRLQLALPRLLLRTIKRGKPTSISLLFRSRLILRYHLRPRTGHDDLTGAGRNSNVL
jgi:hypothetical protein